MLLPSNKTKLKKRTLWFDGDSSFPACSIQTAFSLESTALFVDEMTKDIEQYNRIVPVEKRIQVKKDARPLTFDWTIPTEYIQLDIDQYIRDCLMNEFQKDTMDDKEDRKVRILRVIEELKLYEQHDLLDVLRVLIYVINTLNSNSVVWGVGRGSSVSSYVLYILGVHDVDSVKYDLDITDFLH